MKRAARPSRLVASSLRPPRKAIATAGRAIALGFLGIYRVVLSPVLLASMGPACRFEPSCGAYASAAVAQHGVARGGWMALKRILRCRPGGGWGYDPVVAQSPADYRRPGRGEEREMLG
ncbi:MAG: membrane protein insertion efficiency factor YidD [Candidatus Binataceae bacterium]